MKYIFTYAKYIIFTTGIRQKFEKKKLRMLCDRIISLYDNDSQHQSTLCVKQQVYQFSSK